MAIRTVPDIYNQIAEAKADNRKLFGVLIDPEHQKIGEIPRFLSKIPDFSTHILVGGSTGEALNTKACIEEIKKCSNLPLLLFPGGHKQIVEGADALLFLSLISGRNPVYLIEEQIKAVPFLRSSNLEIIPTGYVLIDGGNKTSVQRVSGTLPMCKNNVENIVNTALAGQYSGKKLLYLEAGSGAFCPVPTSIINAVYEAVNLPVIVGGGIRNMEAVHAAHKAGATMVVVGTALENNCF